MEDAEDTGGLKLALATYVLVFALKLAVYAASGVMALLAEALHTFSDILISGLLLFAAIWSRRGADNTHMFGYGRAQNVAAVVAATLFISFTSYKLYEEAIPRLFRTEQDPYRNLPLALGAIIASMLIAAVPLARIAKQKQRGAAAKAQLLESVNDQLGLIAALVGTLFVLWGWPLGDPLSAIVVATIIAVNAIGLFRENLSFLLGRSPGAEYLARIEKEARSVPGVLGVHDLRAEYVGSHTIHAGMHIEVPRGMLVEEADRVAEEVLRRVHQETSPAYCFIHVDAVDPAAPAAQEMPDSRRG